MGKKHIYYHANCNYVLEVADRRGKSLQASNCLFDAAIRHGVYCKSSCIKEPKNGLAVVTEARTAAGTQW